MKKQISIIICLFIFTICVIGNAFAEAFTVHNGIEFGMGVDEITEIEKNAGFEVGEIEDSPIFRDEKEKSLTIKGTVAGAPESTISFIFDAEGKLHEAVYGLHTNDYDSLYSALQQKYGDPNADKQWISALENRVVTGRIVEYKSLAFFDSSVSFSPSNVWLLKQDDGSYVSIDIEKVESKKFVDIVYIIYAHFSEKEYSEITGYAQTIGDDL